MEKRFHKGIEGQVVTHPSRLSIPLKRRKPTVYAVWNDTYHEVIPCTFQDSIYAVAMLCKQHTFLILTKRTANMAHYWETPRVLLGNRLYEAGRKYNTWKRMIAIECGTFPETGIPNVYHGLTVCNQQEADEKIPIFLRVPGKKFLSIEPMLGAIDLTNLDGPAKQSGAHGWSCIWDTPLRPRIDAVILGGETGPGARPMHPDWAISIVRQCRAAGVPVFVKQIHVGGKSSKDMTEWPEELRVRELPWLNHNLPSKC